MNRNAAMDQFRQTYLSTAYKKYCDVLLQRVNTDHAFIVEQFKDAIRSLVDEIRKKQRDDKTKCCYIEGSFSISAALKGLPCFYIEAYGEDYYIETIASVSLNISSFYNAWEMFRSSAKSEAKKNAGKIYEDEVDRELLPWLKYDVPDSFKECFRESTADSQRLYTNSGILFDDLKFSFGNYRGMVEKIA